MNQEHPDPRARSKRHATQHADTKNRPATGGPIRTCVACSRAFSVRKSRKASPLGLLFEAQSTDGPLQVLRVFCRRKSGSAQVLADGDGRGGGRGAWLCASGTCVERAWQRKGIQRALRGAAPDEGLRGRLLEACRSQDPPHG